MFVDKLAVVNACIGTLGEAPLNTLEDDHSFKAAALNYLNTASLDVQREGFWFNSERLWLMPDAVSKFVYIPQDALEVRSVHYRGLSVAQRGRRLYNTAHNTYEFGERVGIHLIRALDFEELPYTAAAHVRDRTIMQFQNEYDGDRTTYQALSTTAAMSYSALKSEDTRQRRPNFLHRTSIARLGHAYTSEALVFGTIPYPGQ